MGDLDHEWFNKQRIADNDKDQDGNLSQEEITQGDGTLIYFANDATFADADRNGNGLLSLEEMRTFNRHEAGWVMNEQMIAANALTADPAANASVAGDGENGTEDLLLANAYYLSQHLELAAKFKDPAHAAAHPKATKALMGNKWFLVQQPELAKALYPATESVWKRDPAMSRWIRKHQVFLSEHH